MEFVDSLMTMASNQEAQTSTLQAAQSQVRAMAEARAARDAERDESHGKRLRELVGLMVSMSNTTGFNSNTSRVFDAENRRLLELWRDESALIRCAGDCGLPGQRELTRVDPNTQSSEARPLTHPALPILGQTRTARAWSTSFTRRSRRKRRRAAERRRRRKICGCLRNGTRSVWASSSAPYTRPLPTCLTAARTAYCHA